MTDLAQIGSQKVKSIASGETIELKTFWEDQNVAIIFFRRWGCMLCRLWAKELSEIAPVLSKHNIKMIGIGVEEAGSKEFINGKYFDGELYYVDNISTYQALGFKRFNVVTIITSLFWKQSRDAIFKGRGMGLGGDLKGDWVQTGGAVLVEKGGKLHRHFIQTGPGDHLSNKEILQHFGLENEYNPETMANKKPEEKECTSEHVAKMFSEDDMTPDFTEQLGRHDHTTDIKKRQEDKYAPPRNEVRTIKPVAEKRSAPNISELKALGRNASEHNAQAHNAPERNAPDRGEKHHILQEEMDVVDREDHVTQYLSDQMVNTDSEITSLQASDAEDDQGDSVESGESR